MKSPQSFRALIVLFLNDNIVVFFLLLFFVVLLFSFDVNVQTDHDGTQFCLQIEVTVVSTTD